MYMQRLVVDISQQIEQVEIPSKFFEHRKNDGTWSETTAEILRKFEQSEFCAPISDYLSQMAQFEKVIERYDYVFVYRTNQDTIDNIKACFEDEEIERDTLYKVVKNNKTVRLVP